MTRVAAAGVLLLGSAVLACAPARPRAHQVAIEKFAFAPLTLEVARGDTVVWTNRDFVPHTATAADSSWNSGTMNQNGTWRWVATGAGRQEYVCAFHPTMKATLVVK